MAVSTITRGIAVISASIGYVSGEGIMDRFQRALNSGVLPKGIPFMGYVLAGSYHFVGGYVDGNGNGAGYIGNFAGMTNVKISGGVVSAA